MGTDLYLVWNDECVADLGRAHNYEELGLSKLEIEFDAVTEMFGYVGCVPVLEERQKIVEKICEYIHFLIEKCFQIAKVELLDDLKEQGFETLTEYEWERRQQIKNKPDYFEPKFKTEGGE